MSGSITADDRFLLDVMLGKLATYLRMCGVDAAYALDRGVEDDDRIRAIAADENRTLLTRDEELAERTPGSVLLTEKSVTGQLRELVEEGVELSLAEQPTRCSACNGELDRADGEGPEHAPDGVDLFRCRDCGQWFWRGSHWEDVAETIGSL